MEDHNAEERYAIVLSLQGLLPVIAPDLGYLPEELSCYKHSYTELVVYLREYYAHGKYAHIKSQRDTHLRPYH